MHGYVSTYEPCGSDSKNTKRELVEILVFKRSVRIFSFTSDGDDFKNKEQINGLRYVYQLGYSMSKHVNRLKVYFKTNKNPEFILSSGFLL